MTTPMTELTLPERLQVNTGSTPLPDAAFAVRFWERVAQSGEDDCWPWAAGHFDTGYGAVWHRGRAQKSHRIAWELTCGPIPAGSRVLHRCDNPPCCNPAHLFLGTMRDNTRDMIAKGRGNRHGRAVLTEPQVHAIRQLRRDGWTLRELGEHFGVSWVAISLIVNRKRWAHVPDIVA